MGIIELTGVVLLSFGLGVWIKDWVSTRAAGLQAYVRTALTEYRTQLSMRSPWYHKYQQTLKQVATLDEVIRQMDEARNALHKAISKDLVPKIKAQETTIDTLHNSLNDRTAEKSLAAAQLRDTMLKLEHFIGEKRIADAKIMKLEGDVDFLEALVTTYKMANEARSTSAAKRPRKHRELINLKKRKS